VNIVTATPPPQSNATFAGVYPVNTTLQPGTTITVLWNTTLSATDAVTIILYSGAPGKTSLFIKTFTMAAPNTGKYQLTLPTNLTVGPYYFVILTFDKGTTKYYDNLPFTIPTPLKVSAIRQRKTLVIEATETAVF